MPDDLGDVPQPEGRSGDHGGADDEFASLVLDDAFVRAAAVHEPSAQERLRPAVDGPAGFGPSAITTSGSGPAPRGFGRTGRARWARDPRSGDRFDPDDYDDDPEAELVYGAGLRPWRPVDHSRWHRFIAWILALVMGVGVLALAAAAVYRGTNANPAVTNPDGRNQQGPSGGTGQPGEAERFSGTGQPDGLPGQELSPRESGSWVRLDDRSVVLTPG
ncbi:SCO2584 family spore wall biosynthesis protein [Allostreptomyces psammosilenae]|uniref:Uncharacterized protein n=1 Tax=Allostreptomyces psammosilenae TaxID=1892865 RepID=A0A852ZW68_9ACTN|nr:hypothetical protein [Allostreptomyces psammosilenae]NYI06643.1 hypothetical protein [Allostreptomyces psammosilenae]